MPYKVKKSVAIDRSGDPKKLTDSVVDLAKHIEEEFSQVASSLQELPQLKPQTVLPTRPRTGMLAYADGVHWNPGSGEGLYAFESDSAWHALGGSGSSAPRGFLGGLTISMAAASSTFSVSAGAATADNANTTLMVLGSSISKTTAAWAVGSGNGGLDTGAIAANTSYHVHEIERPDTGVVDVCISLSPTTPTVGGNIPAAYTLHRRIGGLLTDGSSHWIRYFQNGDEFYWADGGGGDINVGPLGTNAAVTSVMRCPTGVSLDLFITGYCSFASLGNGFQIWNPDVGNINPGFGCLCVNASAAHGFGYITMRCNASGQLTFKPTTAGTSITCGVWGWYDSRGRFL